MPKRVVIRIEADGRIVAETEGIKGRACTALIPVLETLLDAKVIHSERTAEYHEAAELLVNQEQVHVDHP